MKPLLNTLLLWLGLSLASLAMAEPGPHRHGQEGAGRLDNLAAGAEPSCCPTDGKPAAGVVVPATTDAAPVLIPAQGARPGPGEPCKKKDLADDGAEAMAAAPGGKSCKKHDGGCCMQDGARGQGGACGGKDGRRGGGKCGGSGAAGDEDLRARLHHLERRLDMMQKVLESLL